ncbi:MAG: hypothetical protein WC551_03430 [Patescibacteria group bacterium]
MKKQTLRMLSWAAGALLVTFNAFVIPGCGSDDSPSQIVQTGGSAGTVQTGGSGGTGGSAGSSGTGGIGGVGGSSGTGGTNTGGTGSKDSGVDADAGGASGEGGEAGFGSKPGYDGGDANDGAAGFSSAPNDDGGDADTGSGGSSGTGGSGGTGGTVVVPCPADCSGHGSCDTSNGTCTCSTGFDGAACDTCKTGYKNYPTCYAILSCPANCSGHGTCNDQTGSCSCNTGFQSPDCGSCATGYANYPTCYQVTTCPGNNCSGHGTCNNQTGVCACATGFDGAGCDVCAAGYKNYPTCYAIQSCPANCSGHGTCNDQTGACSCSTGYDTATCGACANGYTGYPNCQVAPQPFACVNPTRNTAFDSFQIDGIPSWLAGGIWGTSNTNVYVGAQNYTKGKIAHWNGSQWLPEDLTPAPRTIYDVWGTSDNDVWVAATDTNSNGLLFHKQNGEWTDDPNKPSAKSFQSVWGPSASDVFAAGAGAGWVPKVWRRSGTTWSSMTTPSFTGPTMYYKIWGLDANHVFVPGFHDQYDNGNNKGILLYFDGSSWTSVQVPADCRELRSIHGTSFGDLWASGITTSGKGVVYRITNNLATWTPYVNQSLYGYSAILSVRAGTVLASGASEPLQAGNLKLTTIDQVGSPITYAADGKAYGGATSIWHSSGKAWFVSISDNGQVYPSGVYTLDCN